MENKRHNIEIADIFSSHEKHFVEKHKLCPEQHKALNAILKCRTAALGGHIDLCDKCGYTRQAYNSCRNRHCPRCQFVKKEQWVDKLAGNLPAVKHFHVVFTIPACLHKLFYINQNIAYSLLFKAAGNTLMQCAKNPKFLGAQVGAVAILHTWGQTLVYHPHIHMIVPAGGLSEDQTEWVPAGKNFFLPVKVLSAIFRGILCRFLEHAVADGDINLPDGSEDFISIKNHCYKKKWVVYCEKPFSCSDNLIRYLGNYTHRVAISNHRIMEHKDGMVSFCYKDNKSAGLRKNITLDADEFIRRFLQHVLPKGFYKIRYFGFMAMCNMQSKLLQCFDLIKKANFLPVLQGLSALEVWRSITGHDPFYCPKCKAGRMRPQRLAFDAVMEPG
jgi:predicted Zn-ribbon and HTH transcriptional regulator